MENGLGIAAQHFQPIADVIGMAHGRGDTEAGTDKGAAKLCDKLFSRVTARAKPVRKIAIEARGMARMVAKFVKTGPVIIYRLEE